MWKKGFIVKIIFILFLLGCFVLGAYLYSAKNMKELLTNYTENMEENEPSPSISPSTQDECPDVLVKKGETYHLYFSKQPEVAGVNPKVFNDLGEYDAYQQERQAEGISCPVLFVQEEYNTQNTPVYRVMEQPSSTPVPSAQIIPTTPMSGTQAGIGWTRSILNPDQPVPQRVERTDASRVNPPYNQGNFAGFDPYGQDVGKITDLDILAMKPETEQISDNPMDPNWGGVMYTQQLVDAGKYKDREVTRPNLYTPKGGQFIPMLNNGIPPPPSPIGE